MKILILMIALSAMLSACTENKSDKTAAAKPDEHVDIASLVATIDACPYWLNMPKEDITTRDQITQIYLTFKKYDNATIRNMLIQMKNIQPAPPDAALRYYARPGKAAALIRVLFDIPSGYVPSIKSDDGMGVIGPWGMPSHNPPNGTVNLLWPFELKQGRLSLTGESIDNYISTGPGYDPVREFDAIAKAYKRRSAVMRRKV